MEVGKSVESAFGKKYLKHKKIFFYLDIVSWKAQSRLIKTKRSYKLRRNQVASTLISMNQIHALQCLNQPINMQGFIQALTDLRGQNLILNYKLINSPWRKRRYVIK